MKKKFVNASYKFITKYEECDELKTKKIKYGLESLYNLLTKVIVMLILSIILDIWKDYLLLTFIYGSLRIYAYGLHAKKSIICWFTTVPIYILGCYFIKYAIIQQYLIYVFWLIGFISFVFWAPADTPARPLIHAEIRKRQKIKACMICFIYLICIIVVQNRILSNAFIYCLIIESICINPLTYLLTKTTYANYKLYYQNHGLNY